MANKKPATDPRLALIEFIKPNGTSVMVNSFKDSLQAAVNNGWLPEKEYKAAKAKAAAEAAKAKAAKAKAAAEAAKAAKAKKK